MKKAPGDVIVLHMCTKNNNHMIYASWDMEYDRNDFCHFGQFFALLPTIDPKNKNLEQMLKKLEILCYCTCVP